ncbi:uncharacterized protein V1513DRAFT_386091 [Lipomyces chichibuensis]|uniref:uncharacterized protein n=1 Tax=Lipomyces chichibuensis TaxID=1546026 RepID=UPI003343D6C0
MDSSSESQNTPRPPRAKRLDYHALNTGTDSDGDSDEGSRSRSRRRLEVSETSTTISDDIIFPDESASAVLASDADRDPSLSPVIQRKPIQPKAWVWQHFHTTELETTYIYKATNKERPDKLIVCSRCSWSTTEAVLQGSSENLSTHLSSRHGIRKSGAPAPTASSDITTFLNRPSRSVAERLEDNILQWIVEESEPFTSVDAPSFKRIFHDLPGIELPLKSASTVKRRLVARLAESRENLKRELESTCVTIGLSLDVWTSKNNLSILGDVGHWLTPEFVYKERVLEFKELDGPHSGENMAMVVGDLLDELNLNSKVLTITGDNASNNEAMISELYENLLTKVSTAEDPSGNNERRVMRFEGSSSYIRCIAHVLNLIVGDILH